MTHSLHRHGVVEDLHGDIVFIFAPAKGLNELGSAAKAKKFCQIIRKYSPVHYGDDLTGNVLTLGAEQLEKNIRDLTNIHVAFNSVKNAAGALKEVVDADLGISVVVQGLFEEVGECCQHANAKFHTIEHSLGILGNTELLPDSKTLEIVTMCGHGLVSAKLVYQLARKVKKGTITAQKAAERMAGLCMCGIFNPARAEVILQSMAQSIK